MVCRIKNRHTFKSLPILNSAYFTECRFVIRHITETDTETETELLRRHEGKGMSTSNCREAHVFIFRGGRGLCDVQSVVQSSFGFFSRNNATLKLNALIFEIMK